MKNLIQFLAVMSIFVCGMAYAQRPFSRLRNDAVQDRTDSLSQISPSDNPDLWLYAQERMRYEDPKQAIRRRAEIKASLRRERIAASNWMGISKSRPRVTYAPFTSFSGPTWSHGNWGGYWGRSGVVVHVDR